MMKTTSLQGELQHKQHAESKHQNTKLMIKPRLQQTEDTYKARSTANVPTTNISVKSNRSFKHIILERRDSREMSMVHDHEYRSDQVGKTDE